MSSRRVEVCRGDTRTPDLVGGWLERGGVWVSEGIANLYVSRFDRMFELLQFKGYGFLDLSLGSEAVEGF